MLILASLSPRRKELLSRLALPFTVIPAEVDESGIKESDPERAVLALSALKAQAVAKDHPKDLVLGADTVVSIDGRILGKPRDRADAKETLSLLSGRAHQVFSGFTLIKGEKRISRAVCTKVYFAPLKEEEIAWYLDSGEPFDKAGSYGIQGLGGLFVSHIEGDYNNVVGLPLQAVYQVLKDEFGVEL